MQQEAELAGKSVSRFDAPQSFLVREDYSCDASGNLRVTISTESTGYVREYSIGSWSGANGQARTAAARIFERLRLSTHRLEFADLFELEVPRDDRSGLGMVPVVILMAQEAAAFGVAGGERGALRAALAVVAFLA